MRRRVVITGSGVITPVGCGREAFFAALTAGESGVDEIQGFDASAFSTHIAGEVKSAPEVDELQIPDRYRQALSRDRKSRFAVAAADEALRQAFEGGEIDQRIPPERRGLLIGAGLEIFDLADLVAHMRQDAIDGRAVLEALSSDDPLSRLQIPADLGARCLGQRARTEAIYQVNVSACAAGTQSVGEAFVAIRDGAIDLALSGGYDSMINPLGLGGFTLLRALSTKNDLRGRASRPFDRRRDGFVLGEGAAVLVLEEAQQAKERGATILGEVLGFGTSMDAFRVTDPPPDHAGAVVALRRALDDARLAPDEIDYVNAHGTATKKNDPAEARALGQVFGDHPVLVSSSKSQFGHLIGAAGALELVTGLFAIQHDLAPATINLEEIDSECASLNHVANVPRAAPISRVMSNSFGFGGQNASIIIGAHCDD